VQLSSALLKSAVYLVYTCFSFRCRSFRNLCTLSCLCYSICIGAALCCPLPSAFQQRACTRSAVSCVHVISVTTQRQRSYQLQRPVHTRCYSYVKTLYTYHAAHSPELQDCVSLMWLLPALAFVAVSLALTALCAACQHGAAACAALKQ
jgi:hypothetical protein